LEEKKNDDLEELTLKDLRNNQLLIGFFLLIISFILYFVKDVYGVILGIVSLILIIASKESINLIASFIEEDAKKEKKVIKKNQEIAKIAKEIKEEIKEEVNEDEEFDLKRIIDFFTQNKKRVFYFLMIIIVFVGFFIRISNLKNLDDKLLGLDPYIFYRYANYVVNDGRIPANDTLRYYPFGFNTRLEGTLHSYVIAYSYEVLKNFFPLKYFFPNLTLMRVMQLYPAFSALLAFIVFFFLVQELFSNYYISLTATAFLTVTHGFLFRTSAGFADKEPIAILLIFLSFFFYVKSLKTIGKKKYLYAFLAGLSTGSCGLSWGGIIFVFMSISLYALFEIAFDRLSKENLYAFLIWFSILSPMFIFMTDRYGGLDFLQNFMVVPVVFAMFSGVFREFVYNKFLRKYFDKKFNKIPTGIIVFSLSLILGILFSIVFFGPNYLVRNLKSALTIFEVGERTVHAETVSENIEPFFISDSTSTTWTASINLFILLAYIVGIFYLTKDLFNKFKEYKSLLASFMLLFIITLFLTNFSDEPKFSWINDYFGKSYLLMFGIFIAVLFYFYSKVWKHKKRLNSLKPEWLLLIMWSLLSILAGRTAVRNIFSATPPIVIIASYFLIKLEEIVRSSIKDRFYINVTRALLILLIISIYFYEGFGTNQKNPGAYYIVSEGYHPSVIPDLEKAFEWIKNNTPQDAVFFHWWDYGYWIQAIANRTTVLDGGNFEAPNYAAEHFFTSNNSEEYVQVLEHYNKPDYLLFVDDDIPKFAAIAKIGLKNIWYSVYTIKGVQENTIPNEEAYQQMIVYDPSSYAKLSEDLIINNQLFSKDSSYIVSILVPINNTNIGEPYAYVIDTERKAGTLLPFNYACKKNVGCKKIIDEGVPEGIFVLTEMNATNATKIPQSFIIIPEIGMNMITTRLLIFNESVPGFDLVYDNGVKMDAQSVLSDSKTNVRIWKINYDYLEGEE